MRIDFVSDLLEPIELLNVYHLNSTQWQHVDLNYFTETFPWFVIQSYTYTREPKLKCFNDGKVYHLSREVPLISIKLSCLGISTVTVSITTGVLG